MSGPFRLGIPVVNEPPLHDTAFVLRSRNREEMDKKLRRMRSLYRASDLIKVYRIGYRPDKPIPKTAYFVEISIEAGGAREFHKPLGAWSNSFTGLR